MTARAEGRCVVTGERWTTDGRLLRDGLPSCDWSKAERERVADLLNADDAGRVIVLPPEAAGAKPMRLYDVPRGGTWEVEMGRPWPNDSYRFSRWDESHPLWPSRAIFTIVLARPVPTSPVEVTIDADTTTRALDGDPEAVEAVRAAVAAARESGAA